MKMIEKNELKISSTLFEFINNEAIPGTNVDSDRFWSNFSKIVHELTPINKDLIKNRESIQKKIDDWHKSNKGSEFDKNEYLSLLFFILLFYFGYLITAEAFIKNYTTGSIWDPPLWIPYSSMLIGATLMILQYIAEIIKLLDERDLD